MSDYTPPTIGVRNAYVIANRPPLGTTPKPELEDEFDRWLKGMLAKAFDEGAEAGAEFWNPENPYRG